MRRAAWCEGTQGGRRLGAGHVAQLGEGSARTTLSGFHPEHHINHERCTPGIPVFKQSGQKDQSSRSSPAVQLVRDQPEIHESVSKKYQNGGSVGAFPSSKGVGDLCTRVFSQVLSAHCCQYSQLTKCPTPTCCQVSTNLERVTSLSCMQPHTLKSVSVLGISSPWGKRQAALH